MPHDGTEAASFFLLPRKALSLQYVEPERTLMCLATWRSVWRSRIVRGITFLAMRRRRGNGFSKGHIVTQDGCVSSKSVSGTRHWGLNNYRTKKNAFRHLAICHETIEIILSNGCRRLFLVLRNNPSSFTLSRSLMRLRLLKNLTRHNQLLQRKCR